MLTMHDNKPYFIESMTVPDYIYDSSMNCHLKHIDMSDNTYHEIKRYTPEYSEIYDVVMGNAPRDVLVKFTKEGKYVGPECNERTLLKITDLNLSLPLADTIIKETVPKLTDYIMQVFDILATLHSKKLCHGSPLLQYLMIDTSNNIGFLHYTFMLNCTNAIKLSYGHKITYYFWEINRYVTPKFLYFFDYLVFVCSLHSFLLIHPDILEQNLDTPNYIKFLAIAHAIKTYNMFRSDSTLRVDLTYIKTIFMSPSYTNDIILNRELQRISLIFIEMEQLNTLPETVYWLSNDVYTNFRHYFKIFDKTYNGELLLDNEIKIRNMIKNEMSYFNIFTDLSSNETYNYIFTGTYLPNYTFLNKVIITHDIMLKINNMFMLFKDNNMYHGSLTRKEILIDVSNNDIQIINLSHAKILHEIEEINGMNDIHTGDPGTYQIDKRFLFFVDIFRLIASLYMVIEESIIADLSDNIVLSYYLIKESKDICFKSSEPTIYDLSIKRITNILNEIDITLLEEYQNELKELSPIFHCV